MMLESILSLMESTEERLGNRWEKLENISGTSGSNGYHRTVCAEENLENMRVMLVNRMER